MIALCERHAQAHQNPLRRATRKASQIYWLGCNWQGDAKLCHWAYTKLPTKPNFGRNFDWDEQKRPMEVRANAHEITMAETLLQADHCSRLRGNL
jgi:hypothetical protein